MLRTGICIHLLGRPKYSGSQCAAHQSRPASSQYPEPSPQPPEGYRLPAEWEPHEATWIGWPHNLTDWPGKFAPIPWVYGEIVRQLVPGEIVRILVNSKAHEEKARRVLKRIGCGLSARGILPLPHRPRLDARLRSDLCEARCAARRRGHCAFWIYGLGEVSELAQGLSNTGPHSQKLGRRMFDVVINGRRFVLEGGSIDVNGRGTLLTTEECLLDPETQVRNPGLTREEIAAVFRKYLGVTNVLWLGKGIAGDDTHGHVDDLCRFVGPRTVVLCCEKNPHDANYSPLQENWERVKDMRLEDGSNLEAVPLPMPSPVYFDGQRLPASYANFYICNAAVLVPTFNDPQDRVALGTIAELVRDRPVIGIHAVDLVWGLGTLHCLTQQQPAAR